MRRSDLTAIFAGLQGVTKDMIDQVMALNGEDIEEAKKANTPDMSKYILKTDADKMVEDAKKANPDIDAKEFERLKQFEADTKVANAKTEKANLLNNLLTEGKADTKAIKLLAKAVDLDSIQVEDGKIKNSKEILEGLKKDYADFFIAEGTGGAGAGSGSKDGNQKNEITKEQFAKMGLRERIKLAQENNELYTALVNQSKH